MKVAIIGSGACGGSLADDFMGLISKSGSEKSKKGIVGIACNSNEDDMKPLENIPAENKILFGDNGGAAKNRSKAQLLLKEDKGKAFAAIGEIVQKDTKLIIISASLDGGTGSGSVPKMCRILRDMYPNSVVMPLLVAPSGKKMAGAQHNTLEALSELRDENGKWEFGISIIDNGKYDSIKDNGSLGDKYKTINRHAILPLVRLLTNKKTSKVSIMDDADLLRLFSTKGLIKFAFGTFETPDPKKNKNGKLIRSLYEEKLNKSPFLGDTENVQNFGVHIELEKADIVSVNDIKDIIRTPGTQYEFIGHYKTKTLPKPKEGDKEVKSRANNNLIVILTGLALESAWLRAREQTVASAQDSKFNEPVEIEKSDWLNQPIPVRERVSAEDAVSKYL